MIQVLTSAPTIKNVWKFGQYWTRHDQTNMIFAVQTANCRKGCSSKLTNSKKAAKQNYFIEGGVNVGPTCLFVCMAEVVKKGFNLCGNKFFFWRSYCSSIYSRFAFSGWSFEIWEWLFEISNILWEVELRSVEEYTQYKHVPQSRHQYFTFVVRESVALNYNKNRLRRAFSSWVGTTLVLWLPQSNNHPTPQIMDFDNGRKHTVTDEIHGLLKLFALHF